MSFPILAVRLKHSSDEREFNGQLIIEDTGKMVAL